MILAVMNNFTEIIAMVACAVVGYQIGIFREKRRAK